MKIRTIIVDDTIAYRKIMTQVVKQFEEIELVDTAINGVDALRKLKDNNIQLVLLDVFMPEMDGVATLKEIRKNYPDILVIMISGQTTRNADITIKALELGAIDFILKPSGGNATLNMAELKIRIKNILQLVRIKLKLSSIKSTINKTASSSRIKSSSFINKSSIVKPSQRVTGALPKTFRLLAIGSSTGGPEALNKFIVNLPQDLPVPVVIVQHMPPVFTKFLAESLNKKSKLTVVEASEGMKLEARKVYLAPGGKHMIIRNIGGEHIIGTNENPPENSCRPAVDVLFRSIANIYKDSGVLAVILTGMGHDGLKGIKALKRKRCLCITQKASSCVVYGMPKAVDDEQLSDKSIAIEQMASNVESLIKGT